MEIIEKMQLNNSNSENLSKKDEETESTYKINRQRKKGETKKYTRMWSLAYKGREKSEKGKTVFNKPG